MDEPGAIAFGDFRLDLASESLERDGVAIALTPKAYALLRHFLAHPGSVLGKDALLDALWPESDVADSVLKVCVGELRRALGDDPAAPRYVATAHRRGYRFVADVSTVARTDARAAAARRSDRGGIAGRALALAALDEALTTARGGTRQLVFVTGEAGIGKTTVVETFQGGLGDDVRRARGQCLEEHAGEAYAPLLDAVGELCRAPDGAAVLAGLRRAAPSWVAALPGFTAEPAAASRSRMLLELVEALEALTLHTPLVLLLEDLHWSDYSTLDLLSLLARRPEGARLLVIATYRPVEVAVLDHPLRRLKEELVRQGHAREIGLELLSAAEVASHLRHRLATGALPDGLAALVHARTDGNPLFMSHLVDLLLARGWLARAGDDWRFTAEAAGAPDTVPETLRQMIARALASLSTFEQEVLGAASVAGGTHAAATVAAALDVPLAAVEDTIDGLARRGQLLATSSLDVWPDGTRSARFAFTNALYRSTLYQGLAPARRAELHGRIGRRLEGAFAARPGDVAAELAHHFTAAGDVERALDHRARAAERAIGRYAYPEAIDHLERAIALLATRPDDATRARRELALRMTLGQALMAVLGFAAPEVEGCYARARELCAAVGVAPERARALRGLGIFSLTRGDLVQARTLAEESLALAESGRATGPLARAHVTLGTTLYYLGELDAAASHLERARRRLIREEARPARGMVQAPLVNCLAFLAMTTWFRGRPDEALRLAEEARALADRLAHPPSVLWAAHVTALLRHARGEPSAGAAAADVAIRVATELGLRQWIAWGGFFRGWLAAADGRLGEGIAAMQIGLEEYRATGAEVGCVYFTATLAEACGRAGEHARGLALVDDALALTTARSERYYAAELHRLRAGFLGERAAREAELRRAVRLASQQGNWALALRAATDLAVALGGAKGTRVLAPVHRRFREGRDTADVRAAAATLDALSAAVTPTRRRRP